MTPLNSHWEYEQAKRTHSIMAKKPYSKGDFEEYLILGERIKAYEDKPPKPFIIDAKRGNV